MSNESELNKLIKLSQNLCSAAGAGRFDKADELINLGADVHARKCKYSPIFLALRNKQYSTVEFLLKRGANFQFVRKSGKLSGFTTLHHACSLGNLEMVIDLLEKYQVNPTIKTRDGVEPIHLAAFKGNLEIVYKILNSGASIDTKLSYSNHKKFSKKTWHRWETGFGDETTLFAYLIINSPPSAALISFMNFKPNLRYCDNYHKTLLMYAIEYGHVVLAKAMLKKLDVQEINQCDDQGLTAVHWAISKVMKGRKRGQEKLCCNMLTEYDVSQWTLLKELDRFGANLNAMVNGDPSTMAINVAASRCLPSVLEFLLRKQTFFSTLGRPLFYYMKHRNEIAHCCSEFDDIRSQFDPYTETAEIIIGDICVKRMLGYPVHSKEVKLMDQLIQSDSEFREIYETMANIYQRFLSQLKNFKILFGKREMSIFDVLLASQKEYVAVAKDKNYSVDMRVCNGGTIKMFRDWIKARLKATRERIRIFGNWQEIAGDMISSLLLPYDCVFAIVENLTNDDLKSLIEAYSVSSELNEDITFHKKVKIEN